MKNSTPESVQEDNFENKIVLATKISQNCPVRRMSSWTDNGVGMPIQELYNQTSLYFGGGSIYVPYSLSHL